MVILSHAYGKAHWVDTLPLLRGAMSFQLRPPPSHETDLVQSDVLIEPIPRTPLNAIRMPFMLISQPALSPEGLYLYMNDKDPTIDYAMVFGYDLCSTTNIVGFFGEYGFVPTRFVITATPVVMADNTTIITQPQCRPLLVHQKQCDEIDPFPMCIVLFPRKHPHAERAGVLD